MTLFQTQNLVWIIPIIVLAGLCYSLWKAGRYREPDKEIYDKELVKKALDEIELREKLEKVTK